MHSIARLVSAGSLAALVVAGCSSSNSQDTASTLRGPLTTAPSACTGAALRPFAAPADPGPGGLLVTVSGEAFAPEGYDFKPGTSKAEDPAFVDGWSITYAHLIVSVDRVLVSENPDADPNDQLKTGAPVAQADGPWAIDLAHPSSRAAVGKGGAPEKAEPLVALSTKSLTGGGAFEPAAKYAFGFETVAAQACAIDVNLDEQGRALWAEMVQKGYVVYYEGTATYEGDAACTKQGNADFSVLPPKVHFKLGFKSPTDYVNCQNPDLEGPPANAFEEKPRGVQVKQNAATAVQITFHADHPFWDTLSHGAPMHFDPIAAIARGAGPGGPEVTTEALAVQDVAGFRLPDGKAMAPRSCVSDFQPLAGTQVRFDPSGVAPLANYAEYMTYSQSTQGHINADGLCATQRRYTSPR